MYMEKEMASIKHLNKFSFDVQRAWHINRCYEFQLHECDDEYYRWRNHLNRSPVYNEWRTSVFKRDNYTCQKCGDSTGINLQAHHKKSVWSHPQLIFDVNNGIALCKDCHKEWHDIHGDA